MGNVQTQLMTKHLILLIFRTYSLKLLYLQKNAYIVPFLANCPTSIWKMLHTQPGFNRCWVSRRDIVLISLTFRRCHLPIYYLFYTSQLSRKSYLSRSVYAISFFENSFFKEEYRSRFASRLYVTSL